MTATSLKRDSSHLPKEVKILAIKFKQLGDVAIMVPALRALREHWPDSEIHVLVEEAALPILEHLPWIQKVWGLPRTRGSARLKSTLPLIAQLRKERFDRSVDFVGNDRGAIISAAIGAKIRLGLNAPKGFWGRSRCYSETATEKTTNLVRCDLHTLEPWGVLPPSILNHELYADPSLSSFAEQQLPNPDSILCHLSASMPKREWPVAWWAEITKKARMAGLPLVFSAGPGDRDQSMLAELKSLSPETHCLPKTTNLSEFLALLAHAGMFVGSDSGPFHFAVGLGTPSIALFGPMLPERVSPLEGNFRALVGGQCTCCVHTRECTSLTPCIQGVTVERLWEEIMRVYKG
jgi:ADP-heptose:LPS heptosyltransferase